MSKTFPMRSLSIIYLLSLGLLLLGSTLLVSCANPGSGPDGGPFDETPPRVVSTSPAIGQTNVKKRKKVWLHFSEAIKVDNPSENVVVSPPQITLPEIKVRGRNIEVELIDSLKTNTTYTIDFSNAITDVTEGNPLGNFTYYFSTGSHTDTLEMSGTVLNAEDLNPVKGILVGLYGNLSDTAFTHLPFERVGRTNEMGHFTIKGIAPGKYHIFALKDMDGNLHYTPGEEMAFSDSVFIPSFYADIRYDTIWVDSTHYDTIHTINYTHFTPDNIILRAFQNIPVFHSLTKIIRPTPEVFTAYFSAPNKKLPEIKGFNFNADKAFLINASAHLDTISYWIKDPAIRGIDSLQFTYTYEQTDDSTKALVLHTDTIDLVPRLTNERLRKQQKQDSIKWEKELQKRHKKGDFTRETPPAVPLAIKMSSESSLTPLNNVYWSSEEPIVRLDTMGIHLELKVDSTYTPALFKIKPTNLMGFELLGEWRLGQEYRIKIDSAAIEGLLGHVNKPLSVNVKILNNTEVGSLFLTMPNAPDYTIVQLLESDKKVIRQQKLDNQRADFYYLKPNTIYLRCILDKNRNGKWDSGNYAEGIEPEEVHYYHIPIDVRANWDIEQTWNLNEIPFTQQKPEKLRTTGGQTTKRSDGHQRNIERMKQKGKQKEKKK